MDAQSRIPKVHNPLEFEDGLAYLMKTDILREVMYFSYDPSSFANLYPLYAEDVWDIIRMNREGIKPESLKSDSEPVAPEFVTAVGDDAINRFDEARKRKRKKKKAKSQSQDEQTAAKPAEKKRRPEKPAAAAGESGDKPKRQGGNKGKGGQRRDFDKGAKPKAEQPKKDSAPQE